MWNAKVEEWHWPLQERACQTFLFSACYTRERAWVKFCMISTRHWFVLCHTPTFADPPTITSQQGSIVYHEAGSVLNLTCSAQNLSIAWYYENVPLERGSTLQYRIFDNRLEISNLGFQQAGWYTCAASNPSGRAEGDFLVVVGGEKLCYHN